MSIFTEFRNVLGKIATGELRIVNRFVPAYGEDPCHALHECFVTENGWLFSVFNDNGDWDYLNCIHAPIGHPLHYHLLVQYEDINCWNESLGDDQDEDRMFLMNYQPYWEVWTKIYQPIYK